MDDNGREVSEERGWRGKIRNWPQGVEIAIVLVLTFGLFFAASQRKHDTSILFSDRRLVLTVVVELVFASLALGFLWLRGWRWSDFSVNPRLKATCIGLLMVPLSVLLVPLGYAVLSAFVAVPIVHPHFRSTTSIEVVVLASAFNGLYEELFVTGYIIRALEKIKGFWSGPAVVILFSALLRTSYHTYQGAHGVASVLPLGIFWAWYYYRYRNLWPLVVAHTLIDVISLTRTPAN